MTINTTIAGLSQNPSLNGPDGSSDPPAVFDDAQRYTNSFVAMLRDGVGFSAGAINSGLGFTPVQQGTGTSQLSNTIKLGWSGSGQLRFQVDATDFGVNWPINVTGNAATATNATNATTASNALACSGNAATASTASNANLVNGQSFPYSNPSNSSTYLWASNGSNNNFLVQTSQISVNFANSASFASSAGSAPANGGTSAACSGTAQNANTLQGLGPGNLVQNGNNVTSMQSNTGASQMQATVAGSTWFWGMSFSDMRIKTDVAPTTQDSLSKIRAIDFIQYRFLPFPDGSILYNGALQKLGGGAQQFEQIDPEWVSEPEDGTGYKQPNIYPMLMAAMHSIKQLSDKVQTLEAIVARLSPVGGL